MEERLRQAVEVRRAIQSCRRCPLRSEATSPVPWAGPLDAEIAVLGEAPGRTEDAEGRPFVGVAGRFLRGLLVKEGLNPNDMAFINSANCFPSKTHTPTPDHLAACRVHLAGQLLVVQPTFLFIVGVTAFTAVFGSQMKLKDIRGRPLWLERLEPFAPFTNPITVWCSYHPAARSPTQKLQLKEDLTEFVRWKEANEPFPSSCANPKCDEEVDRWDDYGLAWCAKHSGRQMTLV